MELQTEILKLTCSLDAERNLVQSYLAKVSHLEEAEASRLAESMAAADEEGEIKSKLESQITSLQKEIANSRFPVIDQGWGDTSEAVKAHNKPVANSQTSAISLRGREKTESAYVHAVANSDTDTKLCGDEGDTISQIPWEDVERDEDDGTGTGTRAGTDSRGTEKLDKSEGTIGSGGSKLVLHHRVNLAAPYVCTIPVHSKPPVFNHLSNYLISSSPRTIPQAEDELRGNITTLRSENSFLTREINDFRHRVALNGEQVRIEVSP